MHIVKCVNWIIWLVNQSNPWIHWISKYDLVECIDFNDAVNLCIVVAHLDGRTISKPSLYKRRLVGLMS